jgi:heme/copper-type cytochrome/quinol oxidase subunit 2
MRHVFKKISFTTILLIVAFGCATGQKFESLEGMPPEAPIKTVYLKGENCAWTPEVVNIEKGTKVVLEVESVDADYNFRLTEYNLRFKVPQATAVTARFYASREGEFAFGCYIEKDYHYHWGGMVGKLIVE